MLNPKIVVHCLFYTGISLLYACGGGSGSSSIAIIVPPTPDNGIVMRSPSYGFKTSTNTSYVRVELREMLRRGDRSIRTQGVNKNNWVFGSASTTGKGNAGGRRIGR